MPFRDVIHIDPSLALAVEERGYLEPTPVQAAVAAKRLRVGIFWREDRTLDRLLVLLLKDFGNRGFIELYMDGTPDLARYRTHSSDEKAGEQT